MSISSFVARPLLAGMFVYGGLDAFRNPAGKVPRAEKVAPDIANLVGVDADTEQLVQFNGAVQIGAGITLALGIFPVCRRCCSPVSLVPTTLAGHRFWEAEDDAERAQQTCSPQERGDVRWPAPRDRARLTRLILRFR